MATSLRLHAVLSMALGLCCVHVYSDSGVAVEPWPYSRNSSIAENEILAALDQKTRLEFIDTPLTEVFDFLSDFHGIPFVLDAVGLEDSSIDPTTETVSLELGNVTLRNGLIHLLRSKRLAYAVRNDVVLITSPKRPESLDLRAYNVTALVEQGVSASELVEILQGVNGTAETTPRRGYGNGSADVFGAATRSRGSGNKPRDAGTFYLAARGSLIVVRAMDSQHQEVARAIRTVYDALANKPVERNHIVKPTPRQRRPGVDAVPTQSDDPFLGEDDDPFLGQDDDPFLGEDDDPFSGEDDEADDLFGGPSEPEDGSNDDDLKDPFGS